MSVCVKMRLQTFQFQKFPAVDTKYPSSRIYTFSTTCGRAQGRKYPGCWDIQALRTPTQYTHSLPTGLCVDKSENAIFVSNVNIHLI